MRERSARRRTAMGALVAATTAGIVLVGSARSSRAATVTGGGELNGTFTLNQFPCPYPTACPATASGSFRGALAGTDANGKAYTVEFPDPTAIPPLPPPNFTTSGLAFTDDCQPPTFAPTITDSGTGDGFFQVSGGLLTRGAAISHGASLKGTVHLIRAGGDLTWGVSAVTVLDSSNTVVASAAQLGAGDSTFAVGAADLTASCDNINFSSSNVTFAGALTNFE